MLVPMFMALHIMVLLVAVLPYHMVEIPLNIHITLLWYPARNSDTSDSISPVQSLLVSPLVVDKLNIDMELEGVLSCKMMALEHVLLLDHYLGINLDLQSHQNHLEPLLTMSLYTRDTATDATGLTGSPA